MPKENEMAVRVTCMGRRRVAGSVWWKIWRDEEKYRRTRHIRIYNIIVYRMEIVLECLECIAVTQERKN